MTCQEKSPSTINIFYKYCENRKISLTPIVSSVGCLTCVWARDRWAWTAPAPSWQAAPQSGPRYQIRRGSGRPASLQQFTIQWCRGLHSIGPSSCLYSGSSGETLASWYRLSEAMSGTNLCKFVKWLDIRATRQSPLFWIYACQTDSCVARGLWSPKQLKLALL